MKLTRWKLLYIFLCIFLIFQTNIVLANNIVVPYEWYRYQGASDSDDKEHDCGPACVAMAIQFIKDTFVPIRDIRNYIGHTGATTSEELKDSLQHWGISYNHLSAGAQNVIDAVNDRNHIVICPVTMSFFSPGLDIDSESDDDPALHYDRYSSFSGGHFIIVKGISDDGNWIIAYDPNVWGSYPYPKYWYSNGEPKGKERYYKLSEFFNAINSRGIEILSESSTIYVPDDYSTIQAAVDAASSGDTIIVRDGTYTENVDVNKEHLTIKSENGADSTIVQAADQSYHTFRITVNYVYISGFTVQGVYGGGYDRGGIYLSGANYCIILNNITSDNTQGVLLYGSDDNTIANNTIINNGDGIKLKCAEHNTISNNIIDSNGRGIYLFYSGLYNICGSNNNTILNNTITDNSSEGINSFNSDNNIISSNTIKSSRIGLQCSSGNTISENTISDSDVSMESDSNNNTISDNIFTNGGLSVGQSSQNTVEGNRVNGKPLVYLEGASDSIVIDAGQVILIDCNNITIKNSDLSNTNIGMQLRESHYCSILNNILSRNIAAISLAYSDHNTISENTISDNTWGITGHDSNNNLTYLNNFTGNTYNDVSLSAVGIHTWNSPEEITYTYNGKIYINYLGNYWSNYQGADIDGDGIGDTTYSIDEGNKDDYPLIGPFTNGTITTVVGTIFGKVTDSSTGNPISEVTVSVVEYSTTTDSSGNYSLSLPPGTYLVTASAEGYRFQIKDNITVTAGGTTTVDFALTPYSSPITIYVPDDCPTIQIAVNVANPGDAIIVRDGIYTENVQVEKSLTIESENGPENTIVQAADPDDDVFSIVADHVNISGLTIKEGRKGICLGGRYCTISDNNINSNERGICISVLPAPVYSYATITNNKLSNNKYGIYIDGTQRNTITENTISSNIYGIYLLGGGYLPPTIDNFFYLNNFIDNTNSLSGVFGGIYVSDNSWFSPQKVTYTYNGNTYTNYLGNYLDDYIGEDADNDGIGDTPYIVISYTGEEQVNYPLMIPFENYSLTDTTNLLGDFGSANNGPPDGVVDFEDLMIFALAYGSTTADANWNPVCDIASEGGVLEPDGVIDFEDLMIFAMNYGKTCADL